MPDPLIPLNAALEGRYRVERELGEGGMATVYLADDLKHERKVAVKVLKPELAALVGAERFLAEIKTTANLTHPHILPLHDSGEADGFLFYVMPYIEGETLRDRLDRETQLAVKDSVAITQKVADALDYAHENGVVHRDIKPANILLSERGEPLVADFGIALAVAQAGAGRITETGLSVGTPHYMSPEQATGDRDVDPRSDVYALGCVLYEMLAGEPPFSAPTAQAVLVRILTTDAPPITGLRRTVAPNVAAALAQALEKLPADRFASAAEFGAALGDESFTYQARPQATVATPTVEARAATVPQPSPRAWLRDPRSLVAGVAIAVAAWALLKPTPSPEPGVPTRSEVNDLRIDGEGWKLAVSPDGHWIVAGHADEGTGALYIRSADDLEWRELPNTVGAVNHSFSPDGQWLAFSSGNVISKVPITSGVALPLGTGNSPHWGLNDMIVYTNGGALFMVGSSGGEPELLLDSDTVRVAWPHLLPNGKAVVFSTPPSGDLLSARILIFEIETGEVRELASSGNNPRYVPTGHLVFGHGDGALMGVPFDQETLQTTGTLVTLLPELAIGIQGAAKFGVSETGTLIYQNDVLGVGGTRTLVEVDLEGTESPLPLSSGFLDLPRYSPDGSKIAYHDIDDLRIYDIVTGASPQFTSAGGQYPVWSPSGETLYYGVQVGGGGDGYRRPSDGREEATRLYDGVGYIQAVSPVDSIFVVRANANDRARDLLLLRQGASGAEFEDFLIADWNEGNADISPDGQWIAYQSDQSGESRIYVHSFPLITGQRDVSPGLGTDPVWDRDGQTLYYRSGSRFLAVDVTTEPTFAMLSTAEVLFEDPSYTRLQNNGWQRNWDIHPDGSRFIMVRSGFIGDGVTDFSEVYLVTNWFEELKQRFGN